MSNYVVYHLHTEDSLLDSCTNHKLYADKAAELGQKAICYTEHGNIYNWVEKKMYANSKGLKYIHGVEIYLTEKLEPKVRDNYHTILIAKNKDGFKELNSLVDLSTQSDHFYYKPRISFDEFLNTSDNIIRISACLQSPLRRLFGKEGADKELCLKLLHKYDYLEIQPHVTSYDQIEYNRFLWEASKETGIPLIAGTDTHSIDQFKAECRRVLMKAKGIEFSREDELDLTYKSYGELVDMFYDQGALPIEVCVEAIENTNRMAAMCEDFDLDVSFKYPVLYDNEDKVFEDRVYQMYYDKLERGIIPDDPRYLSNIEEELRVFRKIGMIGFMLFMSELVCWCWENNIPVGFSRGSVGGSTIAFITGITDTDPVKWNLVFSRFANESRVEIGDIDIDISPSQRQLVYDHIVEKFGADKTAYVLAITTVSDKGTLDEICRACGISIPVTKEIKREYTEFADKIASLEETIKALKETGRLEKDIQKANEQLSAYQKKFDTFKNEKWPEVFKYFDGLVGTAVAQSMHPAGIIVSPVSLPDNYGTFWSEGKRILCINMEEIHEVSLVKYDLLGLKNVEVIKDTCKLAGVKYPKSYEIDWNDQDVWDHLCDSPVGLFQFEGAYSFNALKTFECRSVADISLVTAAIRPSGETFRDKLLAHQTNKNPSKLIDDLLAENNGFLVYQEDTIMFLQNICGLSGSAADNIRRAIGRKDKERLEKALPEILEGYCSKSDKPRDIAEDEAKEFLNIIENSSRYQFGKNHSFAYSMITYLCAYYRYHYPKEFITAYLNNANNEDDVLTGTALAMQMHIPVHHIQFRHSTGKYSCDDSGIYKGVSSIKFLTDTTSSALYALRDNQYDDFIDALHDIMKCDGMDSRKLTILIKLDYFSEFGNITYLLKCYEWYELFFGGVNPRKQFKKEDAFVRGISFDLLRKYSVKETPKLFNGIDPNAIVKEIVKDIPNAETSLRQHIAYQMELLGYIDIIDKRYRGVCVVTDLSVEYTPKLKLYALANGNTITVKIPKKIFAESPLCRGDIVRIGTKGCYKKPKYIKSGGEWIKSETEKEWWVEDYSLYEEIK